MQRSFDTFIFDLDGTLLNTLPDLVALTNRVLGDSRFPKRTEGEILSFVGGGIRVLMDQAVPEGTDPSQVDKAMDLWRELYSEFGTQLTAPYEGVPELLAALKSRGKKLGVLSNKFDRGVQELIPLFFPGVFDAIHGESKEVPRKPDPTGLLLTINELSADPQTTVYVGDSGGDMVTAHNAEVFALGVSWGYRSESDLRAARASAIVHEPHAILAYA